MEHFVIIINGFHPLFFQVASNLWFYNTFKRVNEILPYEYRENIIDV